MCQQHDIEIEIHNDMIQMLEDVNKTNITLKIMQTHLQKENRNKNVIIHHLNVTSVLSLLLRYVSFELG